MTRVNLIPTIELFDQHLMAEYREIPMVIGSLKRSLKSVDYDVEKLKTRIPESYTLNNGHVTFFYDKGKWLHQRYLDCIEELYRRKFEILPEKRNTDWNVFKENNLWKTNWNPTIRDISISRKRIVARVKEKPDWYRRTL